MGTSKVSGKPDKCRRVTLGWTSTPSREGVVILLVTSCDMETKFSSCWVDVCVQTSPHGMRWEKVQLVI